VSASSRLRDYCETRRKLAIAHLFPATDTFGVYYRKSDAKLGTALRSAIAMLKKNGTLKKLAIKYQIPVSDVK
jgi:hypothetical protein